MRAESYSPQDHLEESPPHGHFGWILAPILILDRETQNVYLEHGKFQVLGHIFYKSFCRASGSQFHLGAVQIQVG